MKYLTSRVLAAVAATLATAIVMAMPAPAQAADDTYTPHGGPISVVGAEIIFTDAYADQSFTCEQFDLAGSITDPGVSRAFGAGAGILDQATASGCINPIFGETTLDLVGTWELAITGPKVDSVWPAALTNVEVFLQTAGCAFGFGGDVTGEFDDTTGVFTPTGSTLAIVDDPVGFICPPLGFVKGNPFVVGGSWTASGLSITSP